MEEKVLTPNDAEFLPVQFDLTEAKLNQLAVDYDPSLIPKALEVGDENYTFIHNKVMAIVKVRTGADKIRVKLKADSLAWGRKVDAYAKGLTKKLEDLEAPWKKVKLDLEEGERKASEAKLIAEQKRQDEIEGRVANIRAQAEGLINADSKTIQARIDVVENMVVSVALFAEYQEAAKMTGDIIGKSLREALAERTAFEMGQVAMEIEQTKLAEEKAELAAGQKELADAQAAVRASEDAAKAAEEKESQRKADVKAAAQRSADAAEAAKKDVAKMKKRLPQDKEAREYANKFLALTENPPQLDDLFLIGALCGFQKDIEMASKALIDVTQGGASS
jgi:hypothetical protein